MKLIGLSVLLAFVGTSLPLAAEAAAVHYALNIPRQPLATALKEFARQTGLQVARFSDAGDESAAVGPVSGSLTPEEALTSLLDGGTLTFRVLSPRTIAIVARDDAANAVDTESAESVQSGARAAAAPTSNERRVGEVLDEIVVSAQKKGDERLKDVPIPVTALNADTLATNGQVLLRDYYASVPSLSVTPGNQSQQVISIRGVSTGFSDPTVGIMIDDAPFGGSTKWGYLVVPDIDPGDLARIEILRGPQGTLYGANSMGGILKFVTKDPSFDGYSGRGEAGLVSVSHGDEPGFSFRGSANVPVTDSFAIRASAFSRRDPGYIDNPIRSVEGINEASADGARMSALWRLSDDLSFKLNALYQHTDGDGSSEAQPGLGELEQNYIAGAGRYDRTVQAYSASVDAKLGGVNFTSITGYNVNRHTDVLDTTSFRGPVARQFFGVDGSRIDTLTHTRRVTEEMRLSGSFGERFEWLLGGFYTDENNHLFQYNVAQDLPTGQSAGLLRDALNRDTYEEHAAFADLTYRVTDRFDVQFGARQSEIQQSYALSSTGPIAVASAPRARFDSDSFTYLVTPRFKVSPDIMVYGRFASGYRPGGYNTPGVNPDPGAAPKYEPDKTFNYEMGMKADFFDARVSIDASIFRINWNNIQITLQNPVTRQGYTANAAQAKSEGVELAMSLRPLSDLTISTWYVYDKAVLTGDFPVTSTSYGAVGDRLANTPRNAASLSVQQRVPLLTSSAGFVGAAINYVGERMGGFRGLSAGVPLPRQSYPSYTKLDLTAGLMYDSWKATLYANNVTDRRGLIAGGVDYTPIAFVYIQPRTFGLTLVKTFGVE